jgi:2-hydroxycyclohexanecarboxyl-CoA dehydrogenase
VDRGIQGKVAVVTGGGQGIGEAICERLAEDGAKVAVWDIDPDRAEEVRKNLSDGDGQHFAAEVDVSATDQVEAAAAATAEALGGVDILINNAAWSTTPKPLLDIGDDEWHRVIDVNLGGAFRCIRALGPGMVERRSGAIVNIAALTAFTGLREAPGAYAASKGGVVALTYAAAAQLAGSGVRVNAVNPGTTSTPRTDKMPAARKAELFSHMLLRPDGGEPRMAMPSEIANAVAFLASPASSWMTGTCLVCSGGQLFR